MPQPASSSQRVAAEGGGLDVDLEAGLGEGEEMRAEADLGVVAEQLAEEEFERALEIGEGDAFVDVEAFHLGELREVRGVDFVAAIGGAGRDDADGRRLRFHGADLDGGGLRAQEAAIGQVKGVLLVAGGVIGGVLSASKQCHSVSMSGPSARAKPMRRKIWMARSWSSVMGCSAPRHAGMPGSVDRGRRRRRRRAPPGGRPCGRRGRR